MSYINALQQIKDGQIPPIILLYGSEDYFIQHLKSELLKTILADNNENLSTYDLMETPISEVVDDAETYPFFGEKKLIIAHNPVFLQAKTIKLPFEHDLKRLEQYLRDPVDYSFIVFIGAYDKLDNRKKITKLINQQAMIAECVPIKDYEVTKWVKNIADNLNITITDDAYEILEVELVGNLYQIQNELIKVALYVGEEGIVTKEIVEELISHTVNSTALRLVDAVIERNIRKAISIYRDLEKMNEEPVALIGLLAFQFRMIFRVKLLKQKGYSQFQMRKQLGAHPYVIKIADNREKWFTIQKLKGIFNKLTNADASIKQGKMEKELVFELLLYDLTQAE